MADTQALPVFALTDDMTQLADLRKYLAKHGAKLDAKGPEDLTDNLQEIVSNAKIIGTVGPEADMILASISSLFVAVPEARALGLVKTFTEQLKPVNFKGVGWASPAGAAVRVLSNLFRCFHKHPAIQQTIFLALLEGCAESRLIGEVDVSPATLNSYLKLWNTDKDGRRTIHRLLHQALLADNKADQAAKVMIELLGTYTEADAASALADAQECVRTAVVDPKSFSFDHLTRLSAVKQLEKSDPNMHSALQLFASGTYKDYLKFTAANPKFVSEKLLVDEAVLVKKIRLLTLTSLAEKKQTLELGVLANELGLEDGEQLEEFIIDAIQVNAISGKLNEQARTLQVASYQHRKFGREEWVELQKRLRSLIESVQQSHENIQKVNRSTEVH